MRTSKILSILVENKPGTLFKVVHLIRLMRLNIEGLTLGVTNGGDSCRMTITMNGDDPTVDHVAKQLKKVIDVLEANTYGAEEVTARELALVKINASDDAKAIIAHEPCRIVDSSPESLVVEIVGSANEIDGFVQRLGDPNVVDIARTGVAALPREDRK